MNYVGWNGQLRRIEEAVISPFDHGFLYGIGLFETFRTYGGVPFLLERHFARLRQGCEQLGIAFRMDEDEFTRWLQQVMDANQLQEAYVRLTITAGEAELGLPTANYNAPNALLLVKPLPPLSEQLYVDGKSLVQLTTVRNTPEATVRMKSLHYMNNIIAKNELRQRSVPANAEGLMLTESGHLAEGIVSNLFFVIGDVIYTPSLQTGILPGITRQLVIELAEQSNYRVEQGLYTWSHLCAADEVWLTNSIQELVPVTSLVDVKGQTLSVGQRKIGPVTAHLLQHYRAKVK